MLVDCGVINVIDNKYWFYAKGGKPGKSQQYHMKEEYLAVARQRGEASIQEVKIEYIPNRCRPCRVSPPEQQSDYWSSPLWQRRLHETLYEVPLDGPLRPWLGRFTPSFAFHRFDYYPLTQRVPWRQVHGNNGLQSQNGR